MSYIIDLTVGDGTRDYQTIGDALAYIWQHIDSLAFNRRARVTIHYNEGSESGAYQEWLVSLNPAVVPESWRGASDSTYYGKKSGGGWLTLTEGLGPAIPPYTDLIGSDANNKSVIQYEPGLHSQIATDGSEKDTYGGPIAGLFGNNRLENLKFLEASGNNYMRGIRRIESAHAKVVPGDCHVHNFYASVTHSPCLDFYDCDVYASDLDCSSDYAAVLFIKDGSLTLTGTNDLSVPWVNANLVEEPALIKAVRADLYVSGTNTLTIDNSGENVVLDSNHLGYGFDGIVYYGQNVSEPVRRRCEISGCTITLKGNTDSTSEHPLKIAGIRIGGLGDYQQDGMNGWTEDADKGNADVYVSNVTVNIISNNVSGGPGSDCYAVACLGGLGKIYIRNDVSLSVQNNIGDEYLYCAPQGEINIRQLNNVTVPASGQESGNVTRTKYFVMG